MNKIEWLKLIKNHKLILFYFKGSQCSACLALYPKVEAMLNKYPMIHLQVIDLDKEPELAVHFNMYSVPALALYVEGKEYIREAGIFSVKTVDGKIKRIIDLFD